MLATGSALGGRFGTQGGIDSLRSGRCPNASHCPSPLHSVEPLCSIASLTRGVPVLGESGLVANARNFVPPASHKKRPHCAVLFWCPGGDSNPHTSRYQILNLACLPIPPPRPAKYEGHKKMPFFIDGNLFYQC
jgi:hypothetical protein